MKIIGLINKNSGPGFHRIMVPLAYMADTDAYITNALTDTDLVERKPDAIYYNRTVGENVVKQARSLGIKIVVDVDDYWLLDPHHIAYQDYLDTGFEKLQCKHLWFADAVTTTHERLAEKIYYYNKNVTVVPNAIPKNSEWFRVVKTESEFTRIFWQGSITHERDIELLRGPVRRLNRGQYFMVMAGYTESPVWDRMVSAYTNGLKLKGSILPGASPMEYYSNYQYADICMAPLLETPFNSFKSNLKILEAAHSGLPVIASHVHPYIDSSMPVQYVKSQQDWRKHIADLTDKSNREEAGRTLQEHCDRHYNFETINQKRREVFK